MVSFLRRVALGFLAIALSGLLAGLLSGADWKALKPQGYVNDFPGVLESSQKMELERFCGRMETETGVQLSFVLVNSLNGEPIEDVANTMFRAWGIGKEGKDNGLLLLLSVQDRKSRLEVGYGLEPILPDGYAGELLRAMRPALRANDYGDALAVAAQTLHQKIRGAQATTGEVPEPRRRRGTGTTEEIPFWLIMLGVLVLFLFLRSRFSGGRRYHGSGFPGPGPFMGPGSFGGGPWRGSGGFGGYDSNDSFGGFGGGDSGGGGASSDW